MAKFCGKIGYIRSVETEPGIWEEQATERQYFGDVTRNTSRFQQQSASVNDDMTINNTISIVADPYANENFQHMRYVIYMGAKWKITNAEVQFPRIILTIGGLYYGDTSRVTN